MKFEMTGTDFDELVRLCKKKSTTAQQQLYKLLAPKLFGVCLRYAGNRTEAEDILQDGFVKIFTKIGQFDFKGSFEGWARRVVVNCALTHYRRESKLCAVSDIAEYDTQLSPDDVLSVISGNELMQMVQQLTPQYRTVFNLYAIEGFSHQEISKMLNISEGTSKSNLSRARCMLQEKVEALYGSRRKNV